MGAKRSCLGHEPKVDNFPFEKRLKKLVLSRQVKEKAGRGTSFLYVCSGFKHGDTLCLLN